MDNRSNLLESLICRGVMTHIFQSLLPILQSPITWNTGPGSYSMKKINFGTDIFPHLLAVLIFLVVTVLFFRPIFFDNRILNQSDIEQFLAGSRDLREFRKETGEEGLWSTTMFSGMPAYMINLDWSDGIVTNMKRVMTLFIPHGINNIFLAFISYYILLICFRIRPWLAIAGALAFGLSSYLIIGLGAGHNARIGAIATMPLVMAGIHLVFRGKRWAGFGLTALGMSMHLRESHVQITYYLILIVIGYGIMRLVEAIKAKALPAFGKNIALLVGAVLIAVGTFFGPLWATSELAKYSNRGQSELKSASANTAGSGLPRDYAFDYSNGILEPMTALVPNFYGGSSSDFLVSHDDSRTLAALQNERDQRLANQLQQFSRAYWGPQRLSAPYYAGAIIVFLFVLGLLIAEKKYAWWLGAVTLLAVMMSWGNSFPGFNYFLFDYLPAYNKFRSVTFAMVIAFFSMPLLAMLGMEKFMETTIDKVVRRKLIIAFSLTGGLCFLLVLFAGMFDFSTSFEAQLPKWFLNALRSDRESLLRTDALRSLGFILSIFVLLFFGIHKKVSSTGFFAFLVLMITIDLVVVNNRYFTKEGNYQHKRAREQAAPSKADEAVRLDKTDYRVFNLVGGFYEAGTSMYHNSIGGYSAVRLKRYQELYDSCIARESDMIYQGRVDLKQLHVLNMLNVRYIIYGPDADNVFHNPEAIGNAWFVRDVAKVNNANDELKQVCDTDARRTAVINETQFNIQAPASYDSGAFVVLKERKPYSLLYESQSNVTGLAVFSEIYYPKGWHAFIDGTEVPIQRANYVLRALEVPAGKHNIEFKFEPKPYLIGNKVTMISSVILLIAVVGCFGLALRAEPEQKAA